jgi:RNA polymerase sigma factor (TIGR02999 family)
MASIALASGSVRILVLLPKTRGLATFPANRASKGCLESKELLPLVYEELRRLAARYMQDERANHTLQPTALVHEAFLRLRNQTRTEWQNRAQFLGVAGQMMRRILVDHARKRCTSKRSNQFTTLDESAARQAADVSKPEEILAVHVTLERLERLDPQQGRLVELRYFAGLTAEETAEAMGLPLRTVEREWTAAKAWLRAQLAGNES